MPGDFYIDTDFIEWCAGYGPMPLLGPCPHDCVHKSMKNIAWGPDKAHYTLNECYGCGCRAWDPIYLLAGNVKSLHPQKDLDWMEPARLIDTPSVSERKPASTNTEGERQKNDSLSDDLFQVDTTPCECCGMYPCDEKVCKGFRCCPRCY